MNLFYYDSERTDMKCFLHLTLKRYLLNVVWISSGKEVHFAPTLYVVEGLYTIWPNLKSKH